MASSIPFYFHFLKGLSFCLSKVSVLTIKSLSNGCLLPFVCYVVYLKSKIKKTMILLLVFVDIVVIPFEGWSLENYVFLAFRRNVNSVNDVFAEEGGGQGWIKCGSGEHRSQEMTGKMEEITTLM